MAYIAWPLVDFYRVAHAIERHDATTLDSFVDLPRLRNSLADQIAQEYLKQIGQQDRLGGTFALIRSAGIGLAEPLLASLIKSDALLDLLGKGSAAAAMPAGTPAIAGSFDPKVMGTVWDIYLNAEYMGRDIYFWLPSGAPKDQRFRARLHLIQWHWKLAGLELPSAIKIALAKKLATILKPAKPGQEQGHSQDHGRDYGRSPRGTTEGSMPR
jgi:hypothetical protein